MQMSVNLVSQRLVMRMTDRGVGYEQVMQASFHEGLFDLQLRLSIQPASNRVGMSVSSSIRTWLVLPLTGSAQQS